MSLKIISADERQAAKSGIKGVVFGPAKIGKTSLLYTLDPKNTLFVDLEAGDLSVQDWGGDSVEVRDWNFARNLAWRTDGAQAGEGVTRLSLHLTDDERSRVWWPQAFAVRLDVVLSEGQLQVECAVRNTGAVAWDFTIALHSYLHVDDIAQARLQGLDGCARWDAVADVRSVQQGPIGFVGEYDSVFASASAPLQLHDGTHRLDVAQSPTMGQTVVWNPGAALCARLADMPPEGHAHMLCVEAAQIDTPVHLAPGASWTGWQRLRT